jgi:ribosome modulation factor
MSERARNRGHMDRYSGKKLDQNPYVRDTESRYWVAGWEQANAEIVAADFANPMNPSSLLSPRNVLKRR